MKTLNSKILTGTILALLFAGVQLIAQQAPALNAGQEIQYQLAQNYIQMYENQQDLEIKGHLYGINALHQLLDQKGVHGVKIYNALDAEGTRKLVFKGLGDDASEMGLAFDVSKACPPFCGSGGSISIENIGEAIELSDAQDMIYQFATLYPTQPSSYTFSADMVSMVLNQTHSKGMYLAYGIDANQGHQLILMGLTEEGNIITEGTIAANPLIGHNPLLTASK